MTAVMAMAAADRLDWARDGRGWPQAEASRFLAAGGIEWHVQVSGRGPVILLLHGTGAAGMSFRDLAPILASEMTVVVPDLPGHGFTERPQAGLSLPLAARLVGALTGALDLAPRMILGHSAGAAIAVRMALDGIARPAAIVGVNAALTPFRGMAGILFPMTARMLNWNPFVPRAFARAATDSGAAGRLIRGTGSEIDETGRALYARLFANPAHVSGALDMMANWSLDGLLAEIRGLKPRLTLLVGLKDRAVPPGEAARVARARPETELIALPGRGHLAHEEAPGEIAAHALRVARAAGVLGDE